MLTPSAGFPESLAISSPLRRCTTGRRREDALESVLMTDLVLPDWREDDEGEDDFEAIGD